MIAEKASVGTLLTVGVVAVGQQSVDLFERWGLSGALATLATAAVALSSLVVVWKTGRMVCQAVVKVGKAADHAMGQPERDKFIHAELRSLREEMGERFGRLEQFLDRRATPRDS